MKLEQSFDVAAPVDRVWQALIDVEHVAPCLPGAAVTSRNDDGTYSGTFTIKIGPTTASYTGKLEMRDVDDEAKTATLHAQGTDKRGQGGANATIISKVSEAGDGNARVEVNTDYHITGRLARFGRGGMIEDISQRLLKEFAGRLQSSLAGDSSQPTAEEAAEEAAPPAPTEAAAPAPTEADAPTAEEAAASVPTEAEAPTAEEAVASVPAEVEAPVPAEGAPAPPPPGPAGGPPPPPGAAGGPPPPPGAGAAAPPPPPPSPGPTENEPLDASGLVGEVLLERIRTNPWPAVAGGVLVLLVIRRRRRRRRAAGFGW